jgi:hypothetical protein
MTSEGLGEVFKGGYAARMNKSCCFILQYNTEALVFQYYIRK